MPRRGLLVVYISIPVLLVGGMLLAFSLAEPDELRVRAAAIQALLPRLSAFVERERGLRFETPLKVSVLDGPEFEAALEESAAPDAAEIATAQALLRVLGLLPRGLDLARLVTAADRHGVVGFYSSEDRELVVRGGDPTPLVRRTMVHELTHALDDQHFGLRREFDSDEAATGWDSLIEGSAVRIERRYVQSLSPVDQQEMRRVEEAQLALRGDLPPLVELSLGFPYVYGPELVEQLLRRGDRPLKVRRPAADGPVFDEGEIGQLVLTMLLQSQLDERVARRAAAGWGGDRYVAWKRGAATCVRMAFLMDTPADTRELESALSEWSFRRPGSAASGTSLTTCG